MVSLQGSFSKEDVITEEGKNYNIIRKALREACCPKRDLNKTIEAAVEMTPSPGEYILGLGGKSQ